MHRRTLISTLPALALGGPVSAVAAPEAGHRYVALSLVSDQLVWIGAPGGETGSHIVRGTSQAVPLPGAPFDRTVLEALAGEVPRVDAQARMTFLASTAPEAYARQDDWFSGGHVALPAVLETAVAREDASRLLLVTKARGDAHVTDGHDSRGIGKLTGLGFYSNNHQPMVDAESGAQSTGYVAPYVYVTLSLVDTQTFAVLRQSGAQAAKPYSPMPRQALYDALQLLIVRNIERAARDVLQAA